MVFHCVFITGLYIKRGGLTVVFFFFNTLVLPTPPVCGYTFRNFSYVVSPHPEADDSPVEWSEGPW